MSKTIEERRRELEAIRRTLREQRAQLQAAHEAACERGGTVHVDPARLAELEETCAVRPRAPSPSPLDGGGAGWIRC